MPAVTALQHSKAVTVGQIQALLLDFIN